MRRRQRGRSRFPYRLVAIAVLLGAAVACGSTATGESGADPLVSDICAAADSALAGHANDAEERFVDRAHQRLHELAAEVTEVDRAVAARLLEAKQRVEADLDHEPVDAAALSEDLGALADATVDAQSRLDRPGPESCN